MYCRYFNFAQICFWYHLLNVISLFLTYNQNSFFYHYFLSTFDYKYESHVSSRTPACLLPPQSNILIALSFMCPSQFCPVLPIPPCLPPIEYPEFSSESLFVKFKNVNSQDSFCPTLALSSIAALTRFLFF